MNRAAKRFGLVVGLLATVALVIYARNALHGQDLSRFASAHSLLAIAIAALCYATIIPASSWAWRALLGDLGERRSWRELVEIMAITQLAKYVPGNVGVHLGRAGMAIARSIASLPLILSMLAETILAVIAALAVGIIGILLSKPGSLAIQDDLRSGIALASCMAAGGVLLLLLLRDRLVSLARHVAHRRGWPPSGRLLPRWPVAVRAFAVYSTNYLLIGLGLWVMARMLFPTLDHDPGLLCASFALAWVAGFFAPGAPAGLGVREALMLGVLAFSYTRADALVIVIALRLATIVGDTLCFIAGYALLLSHRRHSPAQKPTTL